MVELTRDTLLDGSLVLWQPAKGQGYRFNLDPVFLASFASRGRRVLELGAGCGVLGLLMLQLGRAQDLVAVERVPEMAELVTKNARENAFGARVEVVCGDLRELPHQGFDTVVFNPPYFRSNEGRPAKNALRDVARFERHGTLDDFVAKAFEALGPGGEVAAIVPVARREHLFDAMERVGFRLDRVRDVVTRPGGQPILSMVAGIRDQAVDAKIKELAPLVIHAGSEGREFSTEVSELVSGVGEA